MKIYTKTGDDGLTSILGKGRLNKDNIRIEAYGTIDELNSLLGVVMQYVPEVIRVEIIGIQGVLLEIGSELASVKPRNKVVPEDVEKLESIIDKIDGELEPLKSFILPGGSSGASWLHYARTVARRAERRVVSFANNHEINPVIIPFVNRLSDLLFTWARYANHLGKVEDIPWEARK